MRTGRLASAVLIVAVLPLTAQTRPDFTGVWVLDSERTDLGSIYGQMRVVEQSADAVRVAVVHSSVPYRVTIYPWQYTFGRWTPRRGGPQSKEPLTRAQWDGSTLVTVKAPDTDYSVFQAWTAAGDALRIQNLSKSVSFDFDFKITGLSRAYFGDVLTYTKLPSGRIDCDECFFVVGRDRVELPDSTKNGSSTPPFLFRLIERATKLEVACRMEQCDVIEIINGRRQGARRLAAGQRVIAPLAANTVIEVPVGERLQ